MAGGMKRARQYVHFVNHDLIFFLKKVFEKYLSKLVTLFRLAGI